MHACFIMLYCQTTDLKPLSSSEMTHQEVWDYVEMACAKDSSQL